MFLFLFPPLSSPLFSFSFLFVSSIDVFRERVDYVVDSAVPVHVHFKEKLERKIHANQQFIATENEKNAIAHVLGLVNSAQQETIKAKAAIQANTKMTAAEQAVAQYEQKEGKHTTSHAHRQLDVW